MKKLTCGRRFGRTALRLGAGALAGAAAVLFTAGCDGGNETVYEEVYVADTGYGHEVYAQAVAVDVVAVTSWGAPVAGAAVRLIVSGPVEQIAYAQTGMDGRAGFYVEAIPGVPITAEVDGGGLGTNFVTGYADPSADRLILEVILL